MYLSCSLYSVNRKLLITLLVLFSFNLQAGPKPSTPDNIEGASNLTAEQVIEFILSRPELVVIDSRKKTEYSKGHIEGAINILNTRMTKTDLEKVVANKSTMLIFYCNGNRCMRSADAVKKSLLWGYTNVYWFRGGWKEWTNKRLPVITK